MGSKRMMDVTHLPPTAPFAKAVFKQIRPHIPRHVWPHSVVRASFSPTADGFALDARFDDLPAAYAEEAKLRVREGGVDLLLASPAGQAAVRVFHAQRWRDTCLYGLVPLLFAIPLSAILSGAAVRLSGLLFALDAAALLVTHLLLARRRATLAAAHFSVDIPSPGLRLRDIVTGTLEGVG